MIMAGDCISDEAKCRLITQPVQWGGRSIVGACVIYVDKGG